MILLSLVAVLTAWCGFESAKWGGDSSVAFSEASAARIEASDFESQARDARSVDLAVYTQWVLAGANDDASSRRLHRGALLAGVRASRSTRGRPTGCGSRGRSRWTSTCRPARRRARRPPTRANALQAEALDFNEKGDNYSLMTVLFALVLFLAAIAQRGISLLASRIVLGLAGTLALGGLIVLFTFPIRL